MILLLFFAVSAFAVQAQVQTGKASFYADRFEGHLTSSGEKYKAGKLTAAHRTLPFGTKLKVTNLANNKSVEVVVNDRGPFVEGRIIDLSKSAAEKLEYTVQGVAEVKIEVLDAGTGKVSSESHPMDDRVTVDEKEFYDFGVERTQPDGYGVQIGTYQELVNLFRLADNLKNSYQKKVLVQVKILNGIKYYSLILGRFGSRDKADKFLTQVKKQYPDAFIAEFERMR
ncbi:MAG: septal ring lytic transglycosylase RlpA family protein [Bacteroidetes bacterium]|nr:septal ring lytic transglycosylase RlpA family protein [Bacteroidota bacterium]